MKIDGLPFPVSAIEFDKIYRVMDKRLELGYSDRELSFLLGYRALYVRDVENPLHTLRYTAKDTNYLLHIFDCKLPEIMAGKTSDLFYQIKVKVTQSKVGKSTYEIFREMPDKQFEIYRKFTTVEQENKIYLADFANSGHVAQVIRDLFEGKYFDHPRTSLDIFKYCREICSNTPTPRDLMNNIAIFTGRRKTPRLILRKNQSGRTVYKKE